MLRAMCSRYEQAYGIIIIAPARFSSDASETRKFCQHSQAGRASRFQTMERVRDGDFGQLCRFQKHARNPSGRSHLNQETAYPELNGMTGTEIRVRRASKPLW